MNERVTTFLGIRLSALLETISFFIVTSILAKYIGIEINYFPFCPHPFWIVVLLISAQYGTVEGLFAALFATIIFLGGSLPERTIIQEQSEFMFLLSKNPIMWFSAALILGELRMKHIRERDRLRAVAINVQEKEMQLAKAYEGLKKLKERLEVRVASETQVTLMVVDALKRLEAASDENLMGPAAELIKILVSPQKFSIYLLKENKLVQAYFFGWLPEDNYAASFDPSTLLYQQIVDAKKTISLTNSNPEILSTEGLLAVPITSSSTNKVWGMIKIEQIPFQRLKLTTIESLNMIGKWLGQVYERK